MVQHLSTKIGGFVRSAVILTVVVGGLGAMATTPALAAKPHGAASGPPCAMSSNGVGQTLTVSGSGYTAGSSYRVELTWPNGAGVADTGAWADSSGKIVVSTYAYWSGTYQASVYSTSGHGS